MGSSALPCAATEPKLTRILRLCGIAALVLCGAVLTAVTRPLIDIVNASTFLRLAIFVAALGVFMSSIAAFWWRDAALRRVEWAAYVGIALLLAEQFAVKPGGGPAQPIALVFGLLIIAIVIARVTRRTDAAACKCG